METSSVTGSDAHSGPSSSLPARNGTDSSRRYAPQFPVLRFLQAPVSTLLDYSGILRPTPENHETEGLVADDSGSVSNSGDGEVSIRIIGGGEEEESGEGDVRVDYEGSGGGLGQIGGGMGHAAVEDGEGGEEPVTVDSGDGNGGQADSSSYQRYDVQQVARWIEQILPFSLLLLIVFIRQHLQGFFVAIYVTAIMFKSNDILRKQTALKGERKVSVLVGYFMFFMLHVIGVYWWYRNDDLFYPLFMVPPKAIPPFWHAIFTIVVNDTMVRQAAMAFKLVLLLYYKNGRGHNFRRQGQILTLVEYTLLLYRALLPAPVWYRFFLNKENGSLFSSLTTGLYLTFKLTSVVQKVQSFVTALKALSRKEVHYGSYATFEEVNTVGDLCAICQEKMHAPILLRCKHIFCEDCVSEWFERERTCPLCRALVRPADLRSFGDGSTTLFFQLF